MNPEKKSGQEMVNEFFNALPKEDKSPEANIFGQPKVESAPVVKTEDDEDDVDDSVKNRRHRRLEAKLQAEREANIALTERVKVLSEVEKFTQETPEVDPDIAKMFDLRDPAGQQNALVLSRKLAGIKEESRQAAIESIAERENKETQEFKEAGSFIDSSLESLEDQYNVAFYGSKKADNLRSEFLQFVEDISPKDEDGNLKEYADFDRSFETFMTLHTKEKPDNSRQREIASRSMQRSQSNTSQVRKVVSSGWDGWKKDMGLEN